MRSVAKIRALDGPERRLLLFCLLAAPPIVAGLRVFGFRRTHAVLAAWPRASTAGAAPPPERAAVRARSIARIAGIVSGRGPVQATCLRRSLLVWWLLRREGIDAILRIGVRNAGGAFGAHAWVEHEGVALGETDDPGTRYAAFDNDFGLAAEPRA